MPVYVQKMIDALDVWYYVLVYGVGVIAMIFSVIAVQFKNRITIILCNFIGQTSWVAYFVLYGDMPSAIACALSAVMLAVFAQKDKWKWATSPAMVVLFIAVISGFSVIGFQSWKDVFPILAGVFAVIANSRSDEKRLRQFSLLWFLFWLINSTIKWYPVAFINDFLCTVSAIIALIRYRKLPQQDETE